MGSMGVWSTAAGVRATGCAEAASVSEPVLVSSAVVWFDLYYDLGSVSNGDIGGGSRWVFLRFLGKESATLVVSGLG